VIYERYWDLDEAERAALTEAQLMLMAQAELMEKGVLAPRVPEELDETVPPVPKEQVYIVQTETEQELALAFPTSELAQEFIELNPFQIAHDYRAGYTADANYLKPLRGLKVVTRALATERDFSESLSLLEKAKVAKETNEKLRRGFQEAKKKADQALEGLWADYVRCRALTARDQEIRDRFAEYTALCKGDEQVARAFLAKAFLAADIDRAIPPAAIAPTENPAVSEPEAQ
jgi:hypothetical protein